MAWTLPRLLRRLGAALVHFQYALPLRCPCPAVVTIHDLSFERDRRSMGRARPARLPPGRPARRARARRACSPSPSGRSATSSSSTTSRPSGSSSPRTASTRRSAPATTTRRAGRTLLSVGAIQERKNQLAALAAAARRGLPLVVVGPDEGRRRSPRELRAAGRRLAGYVPTERARRRSTAAPPASSSRRATRASACPCSRRWRAGRPSSRRRTPPCARSPATPRSSSRESELADGIRRALAERDRLVAAGLERAARVLAGRRRRDATLDVYREALGR